MRTRRRFTSEFRAKVALEAVRAALAFSDKAEGVAQIFFWVQAMQSGTLGIGVWLRKALPHDGHREFST